MNYLGSALFRVTNIGFLTLANLMASLILSAPEFAKFYIIMATVVVVTGIFDVLNAKYMVNILAKDADFFGDILQARLLLALLSSLAAFTVAHISGFDGMVSVLSGLLTGLMLFNSGFLTLFYCLPGRQRQIVVSSSLGLGAVLAFLLVVRGQDFSIHTWLTALILYKLAELFWLSGFADGFRHFRNLNISKKAILSAFRLFPRLAFYFQNILSVVSGRLHAFILPLILSTGDFGALAAAATLMAIYIFFLAFLGTDFFREASAVGLRNARWRPYVIRVLAVLSLFLVVIFAVVPIFYPQLRPFLPFMATLAILLSASSQQGYFLFLLDLDRWIIILSVATVLVSMCFLFVLANAYGLNGAFLAMIATEAVSIIMVGAILIFARRPDKIRP